MKSCQYFSLALSHSVAKSSPHVNCYQMMTDTVLQVSTDVIYHKLQQFKSFCFQKTVPTVIITYYITIKTLPFYLPV